MKKHESKQVLKTEKILKSIICDTCKREVEEGTYFEVTTSHGLWGNDSIDSYDYRDFCSYDCMKKDMDEHFESTEYSMKYSIEVEDI